MVVGSTYSIMSMREMYSTVQYWGTQQYLVRTVVVSACRKNETAPNQSSWPLAFLYKMLSLFAFWPRKKAGARARERAEEKKRTVFFFSLL